MIIKRDSEIDVTEHEIIEISTLSYEEAKLLLQGKGWNYINVWNIYLLKKAVFAARISNFENGKRIFYDEFQALTKEKLSKRNKDEYLNALICFNLLTNQEDYLKVQDVSAFDLDSPNFSEIDMLAISELYYSYPRFKYFHNWFLGGFENKFGLHSVNKQILKEASLALFSYSSKDFYDKETGKKRVFIDTFFSLNTSYLFKVGFAEKEMSENQILMRFWDLYLSWGSELKLIQKINITEAIGVTVKKGRTLYLNYFINNDVPIDIQWYITKFYPKNVKSISLSELTINLAIYYRCSIELIHNSIIEQSLNSSNKFSLQRTSSIFIKGKEHIFPQLGNSYVSHIFIR